MGLDLDWNRELSHRPGAPERLDGIDVYYDFAWNDHFRDGRAQFRHGQALARFVRRTCPAGKKPALLLTEDPDAEEGFRDTPGHRVCVLHLPSYREAEANPFLAYLAAKLGGEITSIGSLSPEVVKRAAVGAKVAESGIDLQGISDWAGEDQERLAQLRQVAGGTANADVGDVLKALAGISEDLDPELIVAIGALFGPDAGRDQRLALLRQITEDPGGRYLTSEMLAERVGQTISDVKDALRAYEALREDSGSSETDLQRFLENNLWLLGLQYAKARPRFPIPRGSADFILERVDGFHDLLELKSPQDPIIVAPDLEDDKPPSANKYELSRTLANALAQVHVYRDTLTVDDQVTERQFGLAQSRDPRLIIVIGSAAALPEHRARVLRELNRSLHRVEIVPYDLVGTRAELMLRNIEQYLLVANSEGAIGQ